MQDVHELNVAFNPSLANDPEHLEACGLEVPTQAKIWECVVKEPEKALDEQSKDFRDPPRFEEPSCWDWTMSRLGSQAEAVSPETTPQDRDQALHYDLQRLTLSRCWTA